MLGGPQSRSGQVRKISPLDGIRSPDRPVRSESYPVIDVKMAVTLLFTALRLPMSCVIMEKLMQLQGFTYDFISSDVFDF